MVASEPGGAVRALAAAPHAGPRWFVLGRVLGLGGTTPPEVSAKNARGGSQVVTAAAEPDGSFAIDVTALIPGGTRNANLPLEPGAIQLVVRGSAPDHIEAMNRIDATAVVERLTRSGETIRALETDLHLMRVSAVKGRLLTGDGAPVSGAKVHLVDLAPEHGLPRGVGSATTDANGSFRLLTNRVGAFELVADDDEHRPAATSVTLALGHVEDAGELRLDPGAELAGRVLPRVDGTSSAGRALRLVPLAPPAAGTSLRIGASVFVREDERFERAEQSTVVSETGAFRFEGAAPGSHRLVLERDDDAGDAPGVIQASGTELVVSAPDGHLAVAFDPPRLRVLVDGPNGPIPGARVSFIDRALDQAAERETGADGAVVVSVRAGAEYDVVAHAEGYAPRSMRLASPVRGETASHELLLERCGAPGALALDLISTDGDPVYRARAFFRLRGHRGAPLFAHELHASGGALVTDAIPEGEYDVEVAALGSIEGPAGVLVPGELRVVIEPGETSRAQLVLQTGGRVEILALDTSGRPLTVSCRVEDARGSAVAVGHSPSRYGGGLTRLTPALRPGDYSAEVTAPGHATERVSFRVERGSVVRIASQLRPLRREAGSPR